MTPAGTIETSADRIDVRVTGAFKGEAAIAEVPIEAGGATFRLGDIATVKRGYEDPPESIVRQNGSEAVGLSSPWPKAPTFWSSVKSSRS